MNWTPINFDQVANGLWVVILALLSAIGARVGFRNPTPPAAPSAGAVGRAVEVAGALIDTKHTQDLIDQIGLNTAQLDRVKKCLESTLEAINALRADLKDNIRALDRNSATADKVEGNAEEVARALSALRDEIIRGQNRSGR